MANALKQYAAQTVTTTAAALTALPNSKWASVSIQADPANTVPVYIGNSLVSTTEYARVLNAGDVFTISGSAIQPIKIFAVTGSGTATIHVSGS